MLADGTYEAIVVDAAENADGSIVLGLAVISGGAKGETVDVQARQLHQDPLELLAMPCMLRVEGGQPTVAFD